MPKFVGETKIKIRKIKYRGTKKQASIDCERGLQMISVFYGFDLALEKYENGYFGTSFDHFWSELHFCGSYVICKNCLKP